LLETEEEQIDRILGTYIEELRAVKAEDHDNAFFLAKVRQIEAFIEKYGASYARRSQVYEAESNIYAKLNDNVESELSMSLAIELALRSTDKINAV